MQLPEAVTALGKKEPTQFTGDGAKPLICGRNTRVMHIANLCIWLLSCLRLPAARLQDLAPQPHGDDGSWLCPGSLLAPYPFGGGWPGAGCAFCPCYCYLSPCSSCSPGHTPHWAVFCPSCPCLRGKQWQRMLPGTSGQPLQQDEAAPATTSKSR